MIGMIRMTGMIGMIRMIIIYRMGLNTFPLLDGMMKEFILDQMQKGTYKEIPYSNDNSELLLNVLMNMSMEEDE